MIKDLLLVGLGGFAGSIVRYLAGIYGIWNTGSTFPYTTLLINIVGSLIIGILAGILIKPAHQPHQLILLTGFCGGFTTFSTFSLEGIKLIKASLYGQYFAYVSASVIGGLFICFLGFWLVEKLN